MAGHTAHIDIKHTTFWSTLHPIDHNGIFQEFFLFINFEDVFQHTLSKGPVAVQTFSHTQMHHVLSFDSHFSDAHLKSAVVVGITGCVISSSTSTTNRARPGVPGIVSSDLSHGEIFKIGIDVAQDILFRTLAVTLVHNDLDHVGHVHPEHFECFRITHKHLIAVLQGVSEQFEHASIQLIQYAPGIQLLLDDVEFSFGGLFFEKQIKGRVVLFVGLSAKFTDDVQCTVDFAVHIHGFVLVVPFQTIGVSHINFRQQTTIILKFKIR